MRLADEIIISGKRAVSRSYAKINLTLDVTGRLDNGYHEIETVMQSTGLFDLIITDACQRGIHVTTNLKYLPVNDKNIAYKAAQRFFEKTGIKKGAKILIHKNIPVAAGLAGGSGNAAAVLVSLNMLFSKPLSDGELLALGAEIGADVPFCMTCGTVLCKGIGEKMTKLKSFPKRHILLVKPPVGISTAEIYDQIDDLPAYEHPTTAEFVSSLENDCCDAGKMFNVMERPAIAKYPVINGIKEKLVLNGAETAMMSGSGSTVFGIFSDYETAKKSADSFSYFYKDVFLTQST